MFKPLFFIVFLQDSPSFDRLYVSIENIVIIDKLSYYEPLEDKMYKYYREKEKSYYSVQSSCSCDVDLGKKVAGDDYLILMGEMGVGLAVVLRIGH